MQKQDIKVFLASIKPSFGKIHYTLLPYAVVAVLWILSLFLGSLIRLDRVLFALAAKLYGLAGLDSSIVALNPVLRPASDFRSLTCIFGSNLFPATLQLTWRPWIVQRPAT
jgi:hypothetical protein